MISDLLSLLAGRLRGAVYNQAVENTALEGVTLIGMMAILAQEESLAEMAEIISTSSDEGLVALTMLTLALLNDSQVVETPNMVLPVLEAMKRLPDSVPVINAGSLAASTMGYPGAVAAKSLFMLQFGVNHHDFMSAGISATLQSVARL